jgi:hypothetical protein
MASTTTCTTSRTSSVAATIASYAPLAPGVPSARGSSRGTTRMNCQSTNMNTGAKNAPAALGIQPFGFPWRSQCTATRSGSREYTTTESSAAIATRISG